jgi:sugar phosphate isomerase/epimerase
MTPPASALPPTGKYLILRARLALNAGMRLAAQMYTLRDFTGDANAFDESLQAVHAIGYPAAQLSAIKCMDGDHPPVDAGLAREFLDANGLVCCATHRPWERLRDFTDDEIRFHQTLGCTYTAIGGLWSGYAGVEGMKQFAEESKLVTKKLADAGILFGYHNHAHEFAVDAVHGGRPYDVLINEAPHLALEIDVYWAAVAGVDSTQLLRTASGRIQAIHFKDRGESQDGEATMEAIGEGNLDWDSIIAACREGGTEWAIVEQDICPRDPFDCLNSSYDFLTRKGL